MGKIVLIQYRFVIEVVDFVQECVLFCHRNKIASHEIVIQFPSHWEGVFTEYVKGTRIENGNPYVFAPRLVSPISKFMGCYISFVSPTNHCYVYYNDYLRNDKLYNVAFKMCLNTGEKTIMQ